jgi:hypothetical protein
MLFSHSEYLKDTTDVVNYTAKTYRDNKTNVEIIGYDLREEGRSLGKIDYFQMC